MDLKALLPVIVGAMIALIIYDKFIKSFIGSFESDLEDDE